MGRVCREIQEWIEEEIEQPLEEWERREEERCRRRRCKWWCLCCNKWFCWLVVIFVKVIRWVVVIVGKWVTRVVCEIVNIILDALAYIINLILSIPIIGGIIRTIWNWLVEIIWRLAGIIDFIASWAGLRLRKKMYVGLVIPRVNGEPIATEAELMLQITNTQEFYDRVCNVNVVYTGACTTVDANNDALNINCDVGGFFSDWWIAGSFFEFAAANCKFKDGIRRVLGYGAEIIVFRIRDVGGAVGCSMGPTHNYVVIDGDARDFTSAHEIGHACGLLHTDGASNLMNTNRTTQPFTLSALQIAIFRNSRHCVFI